MSLSRKQMIEELGSIKEPRLIQEGDLQSDNILRIISSQGAYRLEIDAFPIDGPFELSSDEFNQIANMDEEQDFQGLLDPTSEQLEMIEAGCEPGIPYYRYQMDVRGENPVFSEDREELVVMLIEDVMDLLDCQYWDEMEDAELEDWHTWSTFVDS